MKYSRSIPFRKKTEVNGVYWYNVPLKYLQKNDLFKFRYNHKRINRLIENGDIVHYRPMTNWFRSKIPLLTTNNNTRLIHCWIDIKNYDLIEVGNCLTTKKPFTDKQINSMILHLRLKDIAEMYYLDNEQDPDRKFYDYKTDSWLTREMLISSAIETGWKEVK